MAGLLTRVFTHGEIGHEVLAQIRRLLFEAYDGDFSAEDWGHTTAGWRVVVFDGEVPVSHEAVVPRDIQIAPRTFRTGNVEGVATPAERRPEGLGALAQVHATSLVQSTFEMGALSTGSPDFYQRGWERWRGPSFVRTGAALVRTADEDDGLMVLRFGPSAAIDLAASIVCERRSGDDW
jgi:aminoglycoside 2'-N-acetyltransferase I